MKAIDCFFKAFYKAFKLFFSLFSVIRPQKVQKGKTKIR